MAELAEILTKRKTKLSISLNTSVTKVVSFQIKNNIAQIRKRLIEKFSKIVTEKATFSNSIILTN